MARRIERMIPCHQAVSPGFFNLSVNDAVVSEILKQVFAQVCDARCSEMQDITQLADFISQETNLQIVDLVYFKQMCKMEITSFFGPNLGDALAHNVEARQSIVNEFRFGSIATRRLFVEYNAKNKKIGRMLSDSIFEAVRRCSHTVEGICEVLSLIVPVANLSEIVEDEDSRFLRTVKHSRFSQDYVLRNEKDIQHELLFECRVDIVSLTPHQKRTFGPYSDSLSFE
jgi:hypothetical protein